MYISLLGSSDQRFIDGYKYCAPKGAKASYLKTRFYKYFAPTELKSLATCPSLLILLT